jgi:hypothetical protein
MAPTTRAATGWLAYGLIAPLALGCLSERDGSPGYVKPSEDDGRGDGAADPPQIESPDTIRELCDEHVDEQRAATLEVFFPATRAGSCRWGQDGNLQPSQGRLTARVEQKVSVEVPGGGIICDMAFDFGGVDPSMRQILEYDDNFLLAFNDAVLAASYGAMVEPLAKVGDIHIYEWARLAGFPIDFDPGVPRYCLGREVELSRCTIPPPETPGVIALAFDPVLVDQLSFLAANEQRHEFRFVTMGDNDRQLDCFHEDFRFDVELAYIDGLR